MSMPTSSDHDGPPVVSSTAAADGDDFQFDGYPTEVRTATRHVDTLSDDELRELNGILRWHCFTVDGRGRRFGRRDRPGKRDTPQELPDRRLKILDDAFGLTGKHVLEVGCFEGVHTVGLCRLAATVTAIDSRVENVVKTIVRCGLFDTHPTVFKCDLDMPTDVASLPQVDLLHHVGVLYHVVDPVSHLFDIATRVREGMMLDTHVARPGEDTMTYTARGKSYAYRHFREGGKGEVFAGMGDHAKWLSIETLLAVLHDAGFPETKVLENREERNGLRVLLLARRSPPPGTSVRTG
jgi:tRNA (mo5U34)-methyltransferase